MQYGWNLEETTVALTDTASNEDWEVDLGETVRAIDNMRLVVHEAHARAQTMTLTTTGMASREADCRSSVSSRGSASAAVVVREYQVSDTTDPRFQAS